MNGTIHFNSMDALAEFISCLEYQGCKTRFEVVRSPAGRWTLTFLG
jgi:hypothetical protein